MIVDVCQKMGFGMAEFLDKRVTSEREWDKVSVSVEHCRCGGTDELAAPTVMFRMKKKWCFYNPVVMSPHKHLTVLCYH